MNVTDENLEQFKQYMRIYHSHSDDLMQGLLERSYLFLSAKCGDFPLDENNEGVELMYERARYAYHDALEYFDANFMSMVMNFSLKNLKELKPDEDSDEQ